MNDKQIALLASLAECHAALNLCRKLIVDVEKLALEVLELPPGAEVPEQPAVSAQTLQEREEYQANKRRRVGPSTKSTEVLGESCGTTKKEDDVKDEDVSQQPMIPGFVMAPAVGYESTLVQP